MAKPVDSIYIDLPMMMANQLLFVYPTIVVFVIYTISVRNHTHALAKVNSTLEIWTYFEKLTHLWKSILQLKAESI